MKFTVEREALLDAVSKLQRIVSSKVSLPVLEGILISAEQGKITLAAYNLEAGLKKEIYAKCDEEGDIVISARILSEILRKMNGIQVEIEADDRLMCHIKSGSAVFDIMGMAASDFPEMPSVADGYKISMDGKILSDMVKQTIFAIAQVEGTRPILTGLYIAVKDGELQVVAVDGYRLAIRKQKIDIEENTEIVIAGKAITEIIKLIDETDEDIEIIIGRRLASFNIKGYVFIARLFDGEYVNFEKLIPEKSWQQIKFNRRELVETLERVSLLISDVFTNPIRCNFIDNKLTLSSTSSMGKATENLVVDHNGDNFEVGMNSRFLLEALKACDEGDVLFTFTGRDSAVLITSADENNKDFLYLVMPMRLK